MSQLDILQKENSQVPAEVIRANNLYHKQPISPIALILWHYQQGSQLSAEERKQLLHWTEQSEDRKRFLNDLVYQKKWVELTLMQFLNEFNQTITQIKSGIALQHAR